MFVVSLREGVIAATITPFGADERIDFAAWQAHLERLIAAGVSGILAIGEAGEFHALGEEERVVAMRFCRQTIGSRVHLYGYAGGAATRESVRLAQAAEAEELDAVVIAPPPYVEIGVEEASEQLAEVARSVRIPVFRSSEVQVSVGANVAPRAYVECDAARLRSVAGPLEALFKLHTFPSAVKAAMNRAGFEAGVPRGPVSKFPDSLTAKIDAALAPLIAAGFLVPIECPTA